MGDSLAPLAALWRAIIDDPSSLAVGYEALWVAQRGAPEAHYAAVRERFNRQQSADQLLFLLARCVKNAVRFNAQGAFNQSADRRRRGTEPVRMRRAIDAASRLLAGRAEVHCADYEQLVLTATDDDVVYLDPPYQGTSRARDRRYHQGLDLPRFVRVLGTLVDRGVRFAVSFDGRTGERSHGEPLPASLGLTCIELDAGRSTQATLLGRDERTVESLYLSPALARFAR